MAALAELTEKSTFPSWRRVEACLILSAGLWLWFGRRHVLDDALIHLRFADNLARTHHLTFDGLTRSHGASSLAYVGLLSALDSFGLVGSPFGPKVLSLIGYLALVALLLGVHRRHLEDQRWLWLALLYSWTSPMAIRWLSDGMETSLVVVCSVTLAWVSRQNADGRPSLFIWLFVAALGACTVLLRVELTLLIVIASLSLWIVTLGTASYLRNTISNAHLASGAALGVALTILLTGSLLPDTALAKEAMPFSLSHVRTILASTASALSFGIGTIAIWLLTAWLAYPRATSTQREVVAWVIANSPFPLLVVLIVMRGQQVQGFRYLVWAPAFSLTWNICGFFRSPEGSFLVPGTLRRNLGAAGAMFALFAYGGESWAVKRVMDGRSQTLDRMLHARFADLSGVPLVAGDIGFVSYFSNAQVCDMSGLVHGRAVASMTRDQRIRRCVADAPMAAFLTAPQYHELSKWLEIDSWYVCGIFDFTNLGDSDRHYLLVQRSLLARGPCTSLGHLKIGNLLPLAHESVGPLRK
jgi:hypothetical protein